MMRFDILTIFPEYFTSPLGCGVIGRAIDQGLVEVKTHDIRDYTTDKHRSVDDAPYGGGGGMVFRPGPLTDAVEGVKLAGSSIVLLTSAQGTPIDDALVRRLAGYAQVIVVCGRYEGVDARFIERCVDAEVSLGDFVLPGGEAAALSVVEAASRFIPGVLGNESSPEAESFASSLLEHPHYTRPERFMEKEVPPVLLAGNHKEIEEWRRSESIRMTFDRRPELLDRAELTESDQEQLKGLRGLRGGNMKAYIALVHYPVYNKKFSVITTAFTNLDVHDIARSSATYGVKAFFLAHPVEEQRRLVKRVIDHWMQGPGVEYNPSRHEALSLVRLRSSVEEVIDEITGIEGERPRIVVTDARIRPGLTGYTELGESIRGGKHPYLLLFGTGWGLAKEMMDTADYVLSPIWGCSDYNHLSVRSAAAVILDRLLSV